MEAMGFFASRVRVREARSSHKCILGVSLASLSHSFSLFLFFFSFPASLLNVILDLGFRYNYRYFYIIDIIEFLLTKISVFKL